MIKNTICIFFIVLMSSCSAYFNQPTGYEKAVLGKNTPSTSSLFLLPQPKEQIVVGVYKFKDQTGQYKPTEQGSTFSTAVTQGATSILIKALEDSKWFVPIERENIGNLLNERNIIRSTRQEYSDVAAAKDTQQQLAPLLFAGVLLEGGIISYDTNIMTGGFGARYFGTGAATKYRQDRVTVYLRLVSTSNGKILNTVYVSKTILSQSVDANLFKYVNIKRLLEVETGFTRNEPIQLAVTEAIEKAVEGLVIDGIKDKLWAVHTPSLEINAFLDKYSTEKEAAELIVPNQNNSEDKRGRVAIEGTFGATYIAGDYSNPRPMPMIRGAIKYFLSSNFNLSASSNAFWLANKNLGSMQSNLPNVYSSGFKSGYASLDLSIEFLVVPHKNFTPFIYVGPGVNFNKKFENTSLKVQYGGGLEYLISHHWGVKIYAEHNLNFSDNLDYLEAGIRDDFYWRFGIGMSYYFPRKIKNKIL